MWMVEQKQKDQWQHTSWLAAFVHNAGFGARRAIQPRDCNPMMSTSTGKRLKGKELAKALRGMIL